jgi:predicted O-linked N-acetylglucosamine transferase (SPINDLY family)
MLFDVNDFFASMWWTCFWLSAPAFCTKTTHEKITAHLANFDPRFTLFGEHTWISYFPITYTAPDHEKTVKSHLNRLASAAFKNVDIRNKPRPGKIAIISDRWYRSAVYTSLSPLIQSLRGHYDITLVHFGRDEGTIMDRDMFSRFVRIKMQNDQMDLSALQDNEFSAVIYPDIGMNQESIYLSNIRLAPVQVMMYGHPVSTWGSKIDYFIGGRAVEDLSRAADNYGERLVVIPGMGVYPVYPGFTPQDGGPRDEEKDFVINCAWTAQKVSYPLLSALREIIGKSEKPVVFQFFPGNVPSRHNGFIPFVKDLWEMLGQNHVRIFPGLPYIAYMAKLWKGVFSIDSYPFGGFNTVIDALHLRKPIVTWQTGHAYSRFGPATLDLIGVPELIARNRKEYVDLTVRLINDDPFRKEMCGKIAAVDLKTAFSRSENPEFFRKAIDYLIENHGRLAAQGSRDPVIIE